jgi:hypothetical protein
VGPSVIRLGLNKHRQKWQQFCQTSVGLRVYRSSRHCS